MLLLLLLLLLLLQHALTNRRIVNPDPHHPTSPLKAQETLVLANLNILLQMFDSKISDKMLSSSKIK